MKPSFFPLPGILSTTAAASGYIHPAEAVEAQNRYDRRMEIAKPYMEQMRAAGMPEEQVTADGQILAANAERMAELYGMTPEEYLQSRFAGYFSMTQEEFSRLAETGIDGMFENRALAEALESMGVTKNMSKTQRRMALQPEFAYAYGRVNPESVINTYGKSVESEV